MEIHVWVWLEYCCRCSSFADALKHWSQSNFTDSISFIIAYAHGVIWWQYTLELDSQQRRKSDVLAKKAAPRNRKSKESKSCTGFPKEKNMDKHGSRERKSQVCLQRLWGKTVGHKFIKSCIFIFFLTISWEKRDKKGQQECCHTRVLLRPEAEEFQDGKVLKLFFPWTEMEKQELGGGGLQEGI